METLSDVAHRFVRTTMFAAGVVAWGVLPTFRLPVRVHPVAMAEESTGGENAPSNGDPSGAETAAPIDWTEGKITRVDAKSQRAWINVGSAQGCAVGHRIVVYERHPAYLTPRGVLVITRVVDKYLSEARIEDQYVDAPAAPGDRVCPHPLSSQLADWVSAIDDSLRAATGQAAAGKTRLASHLFQSTRAKLNGIEFKARLPTKTHQDYVAKIEKELEALKAKKDTATPLDRLTDSEANAVQSAERMLEQARDTVARAGRERKQGEERRPLDAALQREIARHAAKLKAVRAWMADESFTRVVNEAARTQLTGEIDLAITALGELE